MSLHSIDPLADELERLEYNVRQRAIRDGRRAPGPDLKAQRDALDVIGERLRMTQPWGEPDWSLLDDRRGHLPTFPADALALEWQTWLNRAAHGAGVTPGHVAVPLLSVASSLIGTARRVRPSRSWSEPLTLWTSVVGFSGAGKTPGIDVTRRALSAIERGRKHKLGELQRAHETRAEGAKAAEKKWKNEVKEAIEAGLEAPAMPPDAMPVGEFVPPRLYASDATIERLAVLLQARPRGMAMIADEQAGLFGNMGRYSNGSDKEFWLETWNGGHYVVERQGRPAVVLDYLLIGITGGFQPDKLARSFEGDDDGMYARILFAWPEEPEFRRLSGEVSEVEPEFQTALMRLIDLSAGEGAEFVPRHVELSGDAVETFERFRQFLHDGKASLDGREREWWAKGATHVLRLAGTLAYLAWAIRDEDEPKEIADEFVIAAIRLWRDYFWPHARAALRQVGLSDRHADARRVLRWLSANRRSEASREDIRRDALSQKLDADKTQELLATLCAAGWLRQRTEKTAGRARHRWSVNPKLLAPPAVAGSAENAGRGR